MAHRGCDGASPGWSERGKTHHYRLHSTTLGLAIRLRTSASFQEKTASTRWQIINKKGARKRPFRTVNDAAFAASFSEAISASRTGTTCAPWRGRTSCAPPHESRG